MSRLLRYLILPPEITEFETRYLRRVNRIALVFFWLHPPAFAAVAALAGTSIVVASALSLAVMVGPTLAYVALEARPRAVSMVYGFTAMLMGGVLVYIGQGPMQIEMHFYFFVLIALLAVFGNPLVILIAAVTVALHHLFVWLTVPSGVFNYDAEIWAVAVHAIFVVLESIAACFVARSFFDNVIGLEKIVNRRTAALDERNRDMAMILDNVDQGLVTVDLDGALGAERSRTLDRWFGEPAADARVWSYLFTDPNVAAWVEFGFDSLREGVMPVEVTLDQLPSRIERDGRSYRVAYQPIGEPFHSLLVVITDATDEVARQRAEGTQRELIAVVEKAYRDRVGFLAFITESDRLVRSCTTEVDAPLPAQKRWLHTLKGNAALFSVTSISELCHQLESHIDEECVAPDEAARERLREAWASFHARVDKVLNISTRRTILVDWEEYQAVLAAIVDPAPSWATRVRAWGRDPTRGRLESFGEQARQLARRLGKPELEVTIEDNGVRIDCDRFRPVWSALVHTVRNAVDHGIESLDERAAAGKADLGRMLFRTAIDERELTIEIHDDGAGIDWARIRARAAALGLPAMSHRDLEEALFTSGVSTRDEVTETSGRGIGMDALRTTCRDFGGHVEIESERGRGTTVRCRLPLDAAERPSGLVGGHADRASSHRIAV